MSIFLPNDPHHVLSRFFQLLPMFWWLSWGPNKWFPSVSHGVRVIRVRSQDTGRSRESGHRHECPLHPGPFSSATSCGGIKWDGEGWIGVPQYIYIYIYTDRPKDRIFFTTRHASEKITIGLRLGKNTTR